MSHRKVRENEIASRCRTIEVNHAGHRGTSQDWRSLPFLRNATVGHVAGIFQSGEEKVVCVHLERNVFFLLLTLEDLELNDWRWIHWAAVCRCCIFMSPSSMA